MSNKSGKVTLPLEVFSSNLSNFSSGNSDSKRFLVSSIASELGDDGGISEELVNILAENFDSDGDGDDESQDPLQKSIYSLSKKKRPSKLYLLDPSKNVGEASSRPRESRTGANIPKKFWRVKTHQRPSIRSVTIAQINESVEATNLIYQRMVAAQLALETLEAEFKCELSDLQTEAEMLIPIVERQAASMTPLQRAQLKKWLYTSPFVVSD